MDVQTSMIRIRRAALAQSAKRFSDKIMLKIALNRSVVAAVLARRS
ncbi:hypothetical protein ABIB73_003204 [Bradyrhizobium sp. F1.4.3]